MCRYSMFSSIKTHFACVAHRRTAKHPIDATPRCQDCGELMIVLGRDFHAPRRDNRRQWRKIEMLVQAGVRAFDPRWREGGSLFDSCGCGGPGWRPVTLSDAKSHLHRRRADRRAPAVIHFQVPRTRSR